MLYLLLQDHGLSVCEMQFRCCLQSSCIWKLMNYEISGLINCNQNLRLLAAAETA